MNHLVRLILVVPYQKMIQGKSIHRSAAAQFSNGILGGSEQQSVVNGTEMFYCTRNSNNTIT